MPSLRESQHSMRRSLPHETGGDAADQFLSAGIGARQRLDVYRNTILSTQSKALRLSFPEVQRLVGPDFFEMAAQTFAREHPPLCADLNLYGAEFPDFLQQVESAAALDYLPDVARLDWAVNRALHATDANALELSRLEAIDPCEQDRVCFVSHPSISMLKSSFPIGTIWRAVLQRDDPALAAIDLKEGPAFLLVERVADQVEVRRLDASAGASPKRCSAATVLPPLSAKRRASTRPPSSRAICWLAAASRSISCRRKFRDDRAAHTRPRLAASRSLCLARAAAAVCLATVFWSSGTTKLTNWDTTLALFTNEY